MPGLFSSLAASTNTTLFSAIPTESINGTGGGVRFTDVARARNELADQNVQQQSTMLVRYSMYSSPVQYSQFGSTEMRAFRPGAIEMEA